MEMIREPENTQVENISLWLVTSKPSRSSQWPFLAQAVATPIKKVKGAIELLEEEEARWWLNVEY